MMDPMMNRCELSSLGIVIPALNAATTLWATLESVRHAVTKGASVIIADGGFQDDTIAIATSYNIRALIVPGTMYAALNVGSAELQTP